MNIPGIRSIVPLLCGLLVVALPNSSAKEPQVHVHISDGNSLLEGLRLFRQMESSNVQLTRAQSQAAFSAASFTEGFFAGCAIWEYHGSDAPFILPAKSNPLHFLRIVEKWLEDHPEALQKNAGYLMLLVLRDACPNPAYRKKLTAPENL